MGTKINMRSLRPPRDISNRDSIQDLVTSVNELSGAVGATLQRAVRVCELVDAGVMELTAAGDLAASQSDLYVLRKGDTMTGSLAITRGELRVAPGTATTKFRVFWNGFGIQIDSANAAETLLQPLYIQGSTISVQATTTVTLGTAANPVVINDSLMNVAKQIQANTVVGLGDANPAVSSYLSGIRTAGNFGGGIALQDGAGTCRFYTDGNGTRLIVMYSPTGGGQSGANWFTATASGMVAPAFTPSCDERLKTGFEHHEARPLARNIELMKFIWLGSRTPGLSPVAQAVLKYAPEYVHEQPDGFLALDKDGLTMEAVVSVQQQVDELREIVDTIRRSS